MSSSVKVQIVANIDKPFGDPAYEPRIKRL